MTKTETRGFRQSLINRLANALSPAIIERLLPVLEARLEAHTRLQAHPRPDLPNLDVYRSAPDAPFMRYSTCNAEDFLHPEFRRLADLILHPIFYHRKLWEFVFILHHAFRLGLLGEGKRALGFGVGTEPLPAAFAAAGTDVTASDAPADLGVERGWTESNQLALGLASLPSGSLDRAAFEQKVQFEPCDMNAISPYLQDYDLCWSSCAYEHLGSIEKGLDFVINSVEKTLKVGGVAIHTTEFNLSSNVETVDNSWTVLFRRSDFDRLSDILRDRGHEVDAFVVAPNATPVDQFVDVPPYSSEPHLKLLLENFTTTSAGIIVRRGR